MPAILAFLKGALIGLAVTLGGAFIYSVFQGESFVDTLSLALLGGGMAVGGLHWLLLHLRAYPELFRNFGFELFFELLVRGVALLVRLLFKAL